MKVRITTYTCGCRESVTSHPRDTRRRTVTVRESVDLKCKRHRPLDKDEALRSFVVGTLRSMGVSA